MRKLVWQAKKLHMYLAGNGKSLKCIFSKDHSASWCGRDRLEGAGVGRLVTMKIRDSGSTPGDRR